MQVQMKPFLALLVMALLMAGCGQSRWTEYRSNKGGYSVEMPHAPKESSDKIPTDVGTITFHMALSEGRTWGFASAYADFPDWTVDKKDAKELLHGARDGALRNIGGKLEKESWIELEGHPGIELVFSAPSQKIKAKARIYLVKNRLYQVLGGQTEDAYDEAELDRFLDSFRLRPRL